VTGDAILERGANRLEQLSDRAAGTGGPAARLAQPLAEDAILLRRMKPSLIAARLKGEAPTDLEPGSGVVVAPPAAKTSRRGKRGGPNPIVVIGVAFVAGIALAKALDWRSHVHPRG
jgi:hypothetical protein